MVKKYVVVIDAPDGKVTEAAEELKEQGYEVKQVPDLKSALTAIATLDRLSLVVVNCQGNLAGHEEFMSATRSLHPQLPVIWLGDGRGIMANFLKQPAAIEEIVEAEELRSSATRFLHDEFYGDDLVQEIVEVAQQVLEEFGVETTRSEPYIKSNLTLLSDVNALIAFHGEGLSGHVIFSASVADATAVHRRAAPGEAEPRYDDLEDLIGEMTNRIVGKFKRVFESRSLSFKLRAPSFIRGPQARYHNKGASPSLAIEFADNDGSLRLEFCIDRLNARTRPLLDDPQFMSAGSIKLL